MFSFRSCRLRLLHPLSSLFFFFNDTATTEIYTLSLHDALPISPLRIAFGVGNAFANAVALQADGKIVVAGYARQRSRTRRSEEHTSELQSHLNLVCRLLLEKKKIITNNFYPADRDQHLH